jgi:flagellar basal-body rod protein FlgC
MDYLSAFAIGAAGMNVEKARADLAALNLAHVNTTPGPDGQPWRRATLAVAGGSFPALMKDLQQALPRVIGPVAVDAAPRMVHEPGHPQADGQGYVAYARITPLDEMLTIMQASRAYQTNVTAVSAARSMAQRALEIGGNR